MQMCVASENVSPERAGGPDDSCHWKSRGPAFLLVLASIVRLAQVHSAQVHSELSAQGRHPCAPPTLTSRRCPAARRAEPLLLRLRLRGGRMREPGASASAAAGTAPGGDLDAEIEQIISNEAMLDAQEGGRAEAEGPAKTLESSGLPRPDTMAIFREVSGSAIHFYDWPSANNSHFRSTDGDRTWTSDRHHIIMDERAQVYDHEAVVAFDDDDRIKMREYWDARYNISLNVSQESTSMEVSDDGRRVQVRMQSGDSITDHVIEHVYMGLNMDVRAIANNMTRTNWTPPV
jgi:hypothetical protein